MKLVRSHHCRIHIPLLPRKEGNIHQVNYSCKYSLLYSRQNEALWMHLSVVRTLMYWHAVLALNWHLWLMGSTILTLSWAGTRDVTTLSLPQGPPEWCKCAKKSTCVHGYCEAVEQTGPAHRNVMASSARPVPGQGELGLACAGGGGRQNGRGRQEECGPRGS